EMSYSLVRRIVSQNTPMHSAGSKKLNIAEIIEMDQEAFGATTNSAAGIWSHSTLTRSNETGTKTCRSKNCGVAPEIASKIGHDRFGHWIVNALVREGITTAGSLREMHDRDLIEVRNIGESGLARIRPHFPYSGETP